MTFFSISFALFFIIVSLLIHFSKTCTQQHVIFLVANAVFYGYWDVRFLPLLAAVILVCYYSAKFYSIRRKDAYITLAIIICIAILCIFKYFDFFIESFSKAFGISNVHTLQLILPLGISFYIFQALSYVLDVRNQKISSQSSLLAFAVYVSFFPQITSGPIVKARDFLPQLNYLHRIKKENISSGIQLFVLGLTKKLVFADRIGVAVDSVFYSPAAYSSVSIIWAIIGYSLQIYFDFSGYSDMAIGIARILDFDLGKNFNMPYLAKNPSEFWQRWHISLSSWFKDYVYIPLGGNRKSTLRTYFNLFVTMILSGLWHGANWTYIVWGALHGVGSIIYKAFSDIFKTSKKNTGIALTCICILCNYIFVSLLWVVFRATSLNNAWQILSSLFNQNGILYINVYVVICLVIVIVISILSIIKNQRLAFEPKLNLSTFKGQFVFCLWILFVIAFMYVGDSSFIYSQF